MVAFNTANPPAAGGDSIVIGYDGSEHAKRALQWADNERKLRGSRLHVVSCWTFPSWVEPFPFQAPFSGEEFEQRTREMIIDGVKELPNESPSDVSAQILYGSAAVRLLEFAETAEMIVVGSRGRGGFSGLLLGSVSQHLGEHARCPVVIIH